MNQNKNLFKLIPKVDELLEVDSIKNLMNTMPRKIVVDSIREEIDQLRKDIRIKSLGEDEIKGRNIHLPELIVDRANRKNSYKLKRVINGTGVVIHTNIGRSLISEDIMENIKDIAINYSNLEYDLDKGERGSRYSHLKDIIVEITGGEDAMVVNNNAAAVLLVLSTIAKDKEVIVSRGELIEIGGSFRIPDVMEQSGAILKAVGTTNKTHLWDFEKAITEETAALLKVHTSNYRILGFTSSVSAEELYPLKKKYNLPLIEDLGSGVLIDLSKFGLEYEPTVQESIKKGVDVVTFSGDKLLGGPQAGIIVGKKKYIDAMKKNPLTRAFRVDKFTISALEATLRLYLDEKTAIEKIPTLKMLSMDIDELEKKAVKLYNKIIERISIKNCKLEIVDSYSEVGGGSLPLEKIPTKCILLSLNNQSITDFEKALREYKISIIARVYKDNIYIDLRTVREKEFDIVVDGLLHGFNRVKGCII
ncbi:L-seryl-tRNA(Sec) selenium transferase [Clostridium sp. Cult2]|uniref:L-seryl-tRNA(Sec) selenium transferase n=1 Tax=Clostridium sp. Cult2 TaxID=2079003 RepID=UPI001F00EB88|nr:L-seryl-tRNA(Sec) selenium transferase [Clostridium sp. Cult2]MCF6465351.1 L-seryl-tRNA(Sec) selenium transferase [Clostridium sp. Cult2]